MITACANFVMFVLNALFGGRGRPLQAPHSYRLSAATGGIITAPGRVAIERVSKTFDSPDGPMKVFRNVTVAFEPGTFTVILGPSGSGKSTLLRLLAGLETPDEFSGEIVIDGMPLSSDRGQLREHLKSKVAMIYQVDSFALAPSMTLQTNVALGSLIKGKSPRSAHAQAGVLLSTVGLEAHARKRPDQVSGGQALRVAAIRALAQGAPVVLADEPSANLDWHNVRMVFRLLRAAADSGHTIIVATHDERVREFADRVLYVEDHRLIEEVPKLDQSSQLNRERAVTEWHSESERQVLFHRRTGIGHRSARLPGWATRDAYVKRPAVSKSGMKNSSRFQIAWQHARYSWATAVALVAAAVFMASFPALVTGGLARALIDAVDRSIDQASVRRIIVQPAMESVDQIFDADWINEWRNQPHVASVAGLIEVGVQVRGRAYQPIYAVLEGVAPDDPRFSTPPAGLGRQLDDMPLAVLPTGLARRLGAADGSGEVVVILQRFADGLRLEREVPLQLVATVDRSDGDRIYVSPAVADAADSWLTDGAEGPTDRSVYRASIFANRIESIAPVVERLEHAGFVTRHSLEEVGQVHAARTLVFGLANALSAAFAMAGALGIILYALASARQNLRTTGVLRLLGARDRDVVLTMVTPPALAAVIGFLLAAASAHLVAPKAQAVLEQALGGMSLTSAGVFTNTNLPWLFAVGALTVGAVVTTSVLLTIRACRISILKALRAQA